MLFRAMERAKIQPNVLSYNAVISACEKSRDHETLSRQASN